MFTWEREIIRELAKEKKEISNLTYMQQRVKAWTNHNDLKGGKPLVLFEPWTISESGYFPDCKCETPEARSLEWALATSMFNFKSIGDDNVITDEFFCNYNSSILPLNMPVKRISTHGLGFHIEPIFVNLEDTSIIKPSEMTFDIENSLKWRDVAQETIGDILNVRMSMGSPGVCLTQDIVNRMGMENMFLAMYDTPDEFHMLMQQLSDDYIKYFKELEKRGMIVANNKNDGVAQCSLGFTKNLPNVATKMIECWGFMDSQETVGVSKDMFNEFIFPYYKKVADCFGLLSYGCCEPVNEFWEKSLSKLDNLRKISISPWCNEEYMGEQLKNSKTIYHRKPSPNFVGVGDNLDEGAFRQHIVKTLKAAKGCTLEFSFRDVYKLNGNLNKPRRAVEIVREEIENIW